jgi:hypothetical protein
MPFRFQFALKWKYVPVDGDPKAGHEVLFDRVFTQFKEGIGDFSPAFRIIAGDILEPIVRRTFKDEQAATTWQELAPSTTAARALELGEKKSEHPILHRSGMLEESFQKGQPLHHEEIEKRLLRWGSDVSYALFHQTGTGKGFGKTRIVPRAGPGRGMAQRQEIYLSNSTKQMMANTMVGRMAQLARMIGFKVLGSRGVSPLEARMAGEQILGTR